MKFLLIIYFIFCVTVISSFEKLKSLNIKYLPNLKNNSVSGIKGKIYLPEKAFKKIIRQRKSGRYSNRDLMLSKKAKIYSEYEKTVIYLIPLFKTKIHRKSEKNELNQQNVSFVPALLAIEKGSSIAFINKDELFHNVFSDSPVKKFTIGKQEKDAEKIVNFETSGFIQVFCDIHAFMSATIAVLETPYYVVGKENGEFEIMDIPPGKYKLLGWHPQSIFNEEIIEIVENKITQIERMEFE
jgi:plastocyanin